MAVELLLRYVVELVTVKRNRYGRPQMNVGQVRNRYYTLRSGSSDPIVVLDTYISLARSGWMLGHGGFCSDDDRAVVICRWASMSKSHACHS